MKKLVLFSIVVLLIYLVGQSFFASDVDVVARHVEELKKIANQGDIDAQFNLGFMYDAGKGVPQDYKKAVELYMKAANQRHALAQNNLGFMYGEGKGVLQNYVKAHMYFSLAVAGGDSMAVDNRSKIARQMTSEQIEKAEKLASEWKPNNQ